MDEAPFTLDTTSLKQLLRPIIQAELKADASCGASSSDDNPTGISPAVMEAMFTPFHKMLDGQGAGFGASQGAPQGMGLPEVKAELLADQQQVDAALERIARLKAALPDTMKTAIKVQLVSMRPPTDALEEAPSHPSMPDKPQVSDLFAVEQQFLQLATQALRVRLAQLQQRLPNMLDVIDTSEQHNHTPKTVERVMMNKTNMPDINSRGNAANGECLTTKDRLVRDLA